MPMRFFFCEDGSLLALVSRGAARILLARALGVGPVWGRYWSLRLASGCASIPPTAGTDARRPARKDQSQVFACSMMRSTATRAAGGRGYEKICARPVQSCIRNFFLANLSDVPTALNEFLQGKFGNGVGDVCRVAITPPWACRLLRCCREYGLAKHDEDFGQTLAVGWAARPLSCAAVLGSHGTRRTGARRDFRCAAAASRQDEATILALRGRLVETRAMFLPASRLIDQSGLDPYGATATPICSGGAISFFDGNPPMSPSGHRRNTMTTTPLLRHRPRAIRPAAGSRPRAQSMRPSPRRTSPIQKRPARRHGPHQAGGQ